MPRQVEYKVVYNNDVVELYPSSTGNEKRGMFDQDEQDEEIERVSRFKSV